MSFPVSVLNARTTSPVCMKLPEISAASYNFVVQDGEVMVYTDDRHTGSVFSKEMCDLVYAAYVVRANGPYCSESRSGEMW